MVAAMQCYLLLLAFQPIYCTWNLFSVSNGGTKDRYSDALTSCPYGLPDGQTNHDDLVRFMQWQGIQQAWLGWRRYQNPWTWLTGDEVSGKIKAVQGNDCGTFSPIEGLSGFPCSQHLPALCQFSGKPCSLTYLAYHCVQPNDTSYLVTSQTNDWFTARALCRHLGGDLAVFHNQHVMKIITALIKGMPELKQYTTFWAGARRNLFITPLTSTELSAMAANLWGDNQPSNVGDCLTIRTDHNVTWRTVDCKERHSVICVSTSSQERERISFPQLKTHPSTQHYLCIFGVFNGTGERRNCTCSPNQNQLSETGSWLGLMPYMEKFNISSAWTDVVLKDLHGWRWISNKSVDPAPVPNRLEDSTCATYDQTIKRTYAFPCHNDHVGFICQFQDGRPCWKTYKPSHCIRIESATYLAHLHIASWFQASAFCNQLGATLAILDSQIKLQQLYKFVRYHSQLKYRNFFYVGARREAWINKEQRYGNIFFSHPLKAVNYLMQANLIRAAANRAKGL